MAAASGVSHTRVLMGLILGAVAGCAVNALAAADAKNYLDPNDSLAVQGVARSVKYFAKPVGDIFLNLLFLGIVPLVFASIALGVGRLGAGAGKLGAKTLAYSIVTTAFAAVIGLTLVNLARPGDQLPPDKRQELMTYYGGEALEKNSKGGQLGVQTIVNIVPRYPLKSMVDMDMLAIIFTAILVGVAITRIEPTHAAQLTLFLEGVNQVTDYIIRTAMSIAPYAVFCLIYQTTALFGFDFLKTLATFVGTVLGGLALHQFLILPLLVYTVGGMKPLEFFRRTRVAALTAFSTSSSSATLPTTIRTAELELGVPSPIARFVLPLSATMNHNGTALFESVTALFLAQAFGIDLTLGQQVIVLVLCIVTATGMAGVPGGSLPLIGLVISQVGVPPEAIAIVLGVDRILDMSRTAVNVTADLTTVLYVSKGRRGQPTEMRPEVPDYAPAETIVT